MPDAPKLPDKGTEAAEKTKSAEPRKLVGADDAVDQNKRMREDKARWEDPNRPPSKETKGGLYTPSSEFRELLAELAGSAASELGGPVAKAAAEALTTAARTAEAAGKGASATDAPASATKSASELPVAQPADASAKSEQHPPTPLSEGQKEELKDKAAKIHFLAGFESSIYTKADSKAINELLRGLNQSQVEELNNQWKKLPNCTDLKEDLGKCRDYSGSGADVLTGLLHKDDATRAAATIHRCLTEHNETTGRTNWEVNKDLRLTLSHMTSKQLSEANEKFKELYPGEGKDMKSAIEHNEKVPADVRTALDSYMRGVDQRSPEDTVKMAQAALDTKNIDMFKEVMSTASEAGRKSFLAQDGDRKMEEAFGGRITNILSGNVTDQQLQQARNYAHGDQNFFTIQEINDNAGSKSFGFFSDREGIHSALDKMTDNQREMYSKGKELAQSFPKDYEEAAIRYDELSKDQQNEYKFYKQLQGSMEKAVRPAELLGLEDRIAVKGGSLISKIAQGQGYFYNSGADEHLSAIENMSEREWTTLRDHIKGVNGPAHPLYREQMVNALQEMNVQNMGRIGDVEIKKIMDVFDKKMSADTFEASQKVGKRDLSDQLDNLTHAVTANDRAGMLDSISKMPPDQQEKYRTDETFQKETDNRLLKLKQATSDDAYDQAQRMLVMIKGDKHGMLGQIANMTEEDRHKFLDKESGAKTLEEWQKKVNQSMPDGEGREAAQRMLRQIAQGHEPELKDIHVKLAGYGSQWTGDPRDVVRSMEQAFKDDPNLQERVKNPQTEEDRKLSEQFNDLAIRAFGVDDYFDYGQKLINSEDGQLDLATKVEMDQGMLSNDRQGALKDLSAALQRDPKLFERNQDLKEQFLKSMDGWTQNDAQREVAKKVIEQNGQLEAEDQLRSHILDYGHSDKIMATLREMAPDKLDQASQRYAKKYGSDMLADLHLKLNSSDGKEAARMFWRPTSAGELFDRVKEDYLDSRSGFGSAFADNIGGSGTGYQVDNDMHHMAGILADAGRSGEPLSAKQQKELFDKIHSDVCGFTQDLTNFQASKSACAEYAATAVMSAVAVAGAFESGGASLGLLGKVANFAGSAGGNALVNTGLQMAMMGSDYDWSVKNVVSDLGSGYIDGQIFNKVGAGQVGAVLGIGERAATATAGTAVKEMLEHEGLGLTRALATTEAKSAFHAALKDELANVMRHGMLQGEKQISHQMLEQASHNALRQVFTQEALAGGRQLTAEALEKEVRNGFENLARHKLGEGGFNELEKRLKNEALQSMGKRAEEELSAQQLKQLKDLVGSRLAQAAVKDLGHPISRQLETALKEQSTSFLRNLVDFAGGYTNPAVRYAQGVGLATMGGGVGGAITGTLHGLENWDASKTAGDNLSAMREHISGSILSAMMGAAKMHSLSMMTHHAVHEKVKVQAEGRSLTSEPVLAAPRLEDVPEIKSTRQELPGKNEESATLPRGGEYRFSDGEVMSVKDHSNRLTGFEYNRSKYPDGEPSIVRLHDGTVLERGEADEYSFRYPEGHPKHNLAPEVLKGLVVVDHDGVVGIGNNIEYQKFRPDGTLERRSHPDFLQHRSGSENLRSEVDNALLELPLSMRQELLNQGIKVALVDQLSELPHPKLPNWADKWTPEQRADLAKLIGDSEDTQGFFRSSQKVIAVAEQYLRPDGLARTENLQGVLRHEFGHALNSGEAKSSNKLEFTKAFEKDLKRIEQLSTTERERLKYFSNDPEEAFAEVFGSLYGGGGSGNKELILKAFPETAEVMRNQLKRLDPGLAAAQEKLPMNNGAFIRSEFLKRLEAQADLSGSKGTAEIKDASREAVSRLRGGAGSDGQFKRSMLADGQTKVEGPYRGTGHFIENSKGEVVRIVDASNREFNIVRGTTGEINEISSSSGEQFKARTDGKWDHSWAEKETVTGLKLDAKSGLTFETSELKQEQRPVQKLAGPSVLDSNGNVKSFFDPDGIQYEVERDFSGAIKEITSRSGERFMAQDGGRWLHVSAPQVEVVSGLKVGKDGSFEYKNQSKETFSKRLDGSLEKTKWTSSELVKVDHTAEKNRFEQVLRDSVPTAISRQKFFDQMAAFEARGERLKIAPSDRARVYHYLSEIMTAKEAKLPYDQRLELSRQLLRDCNNPFAINQGYHNSCNVATVQVGMFAKNPAVPAKMLKEIVLKGEFNTVFGQTVHLRQADIIKEMESRRESVHPGSGERGLRSHLDQIMQVGLLNAYYQTHSIDTRYELHKSSQSGDTGERVVKTTDALESPPGVQGGSASDRSKFADRFAELKAPERKGSEFGGLNAQQIDAVYRLMMGMTEYLNMMGSHNSEARFISALEKIEPSEKNPVVLMVHTSAEPFYKDSNAGQAGGSGGWHVVNIIGVERDQAGAISKVYVDNQWGAKAEHLQGIGDPIRVRDAWLSTLDPLDGAHAKELERDVASNPNDLLKRIELERFKHGLYQHKNDAVLDAYRAQGVPFSSTADYVRELRRLKAELPHYEEAVRKGKLKPEELQYARQVIEAQSYRADKKLYEQGVLERIKSWLPSARREPPKFTSRAATAGTMKDIERNRIASLAERLGESSEEI